MKWFHLAYNQKPYCSYGILYCFWPNYSRWRGSRIYDREEGDYSNDRGWRFFEGSEDQDYTDDYSHFEVYDVNTIANYDNEIIPLLGSPVGSAFERTPNGFEPVSKE